MRSNSTMARSTPNDNIIQLVGFSVGAELFGTDILSVREILRQPPVEPLKRGPDFIEGITRVRGAAIPVIDLAAYIGKNASRRDKSRHWVLVTQVQETLIGFIVDAVTRILKINTDMIMPAPELILSGLRNQYMRGVCDTEKGLLMVLELDRLLVDEEVRTIRDLKLK